jgi:hypothetical protein
MSAIPAGTKIPIAVPWDCKILAVCAYATVGVPGSIQVDIWKCTHNEFDLGPPPVHPVDADSITDVHPVVITDGDKYYDDELINWDVHCKKGDIITFYVDSCVDLERITIELKLVTT